MAESKLTDDEVVVSVLGGRRQEFEILVHRYSSHFSPTAVARPRLFYFEIKRLKFSNETETRVTAIAARACRSFQK